MTLCVLFFVVILKSVPATSIVSRLFLDSLVAKVKIFLCLEFIVSFFFYPVYMRQTKIATMSSKASERSIVDATKK